MRLSICDWQAAGWPTKTIDSVCTRVTSGGTPRRRVDGYYTDQGGVPWVKTQELNDGYIDVTEEHITERALAESSAKRLPTGTVLVAMYGATVGKLAILGQEMACNQASCALLVDPDQADQRYLFYQLLAARTELQSLATGAAQQNLSARAIKEIELPVPPVDEQRRIAGVLGALDELIDTNRRLVRSLEAAISAAFARLMAETADVVRRPMDKIASIVGGSTPSTRVPEYWDGGSHAWATPKDLSGLPSTPLLDTERKITDAGLARISSGMLPEGTVLMSSRAPVGYLAIAEVPVAVNQGFIALKCDKGVPNYFVWQWLAHNMDLIKQNAGGTTFAEISKRNFRPIEVSVPFDSALADFDMLVDPLYRQVVELEVESRDLSRARDALLPLLLSGRVSPGEVAA